MATYPPSWSACSDASECSVAPSARDLHPAIAHSILSNVESPVPSLRHSTTGWTPCDAPSPRRYSVARRAGFCTFSRPFDGVQLEPIPRDAFRFDCIRKRLNLLLCRFFVSMSIYRNIADAMRTGIQFTGKCSRLDGNGRLRGFRRRRSARQNPIWGISFEMAPLCNRPRHLHVSAALRVASCSYRSIGSEVQRTGSLPDPSSSHAHPAYCMRTGRSSTLRKQDLGAREVIGMIECYKRDQRRRGRWQPLATLTSSSFMAQPILHSRRCARTSDVRTRRRRDKFCMNR